MEEQSTMYTKYEREVIFSIPLNIDSIEKMLVNLCDIYTREDECLFSLKGIKDNIYFEVAADSHYDEYVDEMYNSTGRRLTEEELAELKKYTYVLYLTTKVNYSIDLVPALNSILDIIKKMGLGFKVETSGFGFSKEYLLQNYPNGITELDLTRLLVGSVYSEDSVYTCGMKNLGEFKEIVIQLGEISLEDTLKFMQSTINYIVYDGAILNDGDTIDIAGNPPTYSISSIPYDNYGVELFENKLGAWKFILKDNENI